MSYQPRNPKAQEWAGKLTTLYRKEGVPPPEVQEYFDGLLKHIDRLEDDIDPEAKRPQRLRSSPNMPRKAIK